MKKIICENLRIPLKLWLDDIEDGALLQARNLANLPFAFRHIAIMPDSHQGYGMPIGAVLATKDVVIPNAVGVDIGCGMCAVRTSLPTINEHELKSVMGGSKEFKGGIRSKIPLGFRHHSKKQSELRMPVPMDGDHYVIDAEYSSALFQLGTLGGGNHFIEIQKGDDGYIWIMIHSGSRNLGYQVARHHNNIARDLNKKYYSSVPDKSELAFLPLNTDEAKNYLEEMDYCVEFAFKSRRLMMERVKYSMMDVFGQIDFGQMINVSHNFAQQENHFGSNVMVHRKGATLAHKGQLGIIPGSQGTNSYIVKGKGNPESFQSCSHGAGRKMGRKQACRELDFDVEINKLNKMGVMHSVRNVKDLDEAPGSYKDINVVMQNQEDLVDMEVKLTPLAVIKG